MFLSRQISFGETYQRKRALKSVFHSSDNSSYLSEFEDQKAGYSWAVKVSIPLLVA